jgi:GT2 family glycosyltransferase
VSVAVSLVTYRSARHIDACLDAVRAQGGSVAEVLLVDNGSRDGTLERVRARHPEVLTLALDRNVGYAAAHNRNFRRSRSEFFLALNPDVVLHARHLEELLACMAREPGIGAVGGRLLSPGPQPRLDSAGIAWQRGRMRFVDRGRGASPDAYDREEDVFGTCGAATLYRREALRSVCAPAETPFAERLFMYYEDVDLGWRLRRAGWRVRYCPRALATHARGGSGANAAFVEYHLVRNRLWVSLRNAGPGELLRELPGLALLETAKLVQSLSRPHLRAALRDQVRGIRASLAERRRGAAEA